MMQGPNGSRYLRFEAGGGTVIIEGTDDTPGMGPVAQRGAVEETGKRLESALQQLGDILTPLRTHVLKQLAEAEQVSVEFGLKVSAEAGLIVAKTGFEGNFKVSVVWKK